MCLAVKINISCSIHFIQSVLLQREAYILCHYYFNCIIPVGTYFPASTMDQWRYETQT